MAAPVLAGLLLAGCGPTSPPAQAPSVSAPGTITSAPTIPGETIPGAGGPGAAQTTLDRLAAAVRSGDRAAYEASVSRADPGFSPDRLWTGLQAMPLAQFDLAAVGAPAGLEPARRAVLPDGWRQRVRVTWRLAGERHPAQHELSWTLAGEPGAVRLAGTAGPPDAAPAPQPLWAIETVQERSAAAVSVLTGPGLDPDRWLAAARAAREAVTTALPAGLRAGPDRLVVEVPSTRAGFERVLGVAPGSYHQIAAVSWPEGPDPGTAAVRIVVNPDLAGRLAPPALRVLLVHEATHVATRSVTSPAPLWLVEGYPDYLAFAAVPDAEPPPHPAPARGTPASLPADQEFRPDNPQLDRAYALALSACRFIAARYSPEALAELYRLSDRGVEPGQAIQAALGVSQRQLIEQWHAAHPEPAGG